MTAPMHLNANSNCFENAKDLRKSATEAEKMLWKSLRARRFLNLKFRRQHPFAKYILDFYCDEKKLCIEVDGSSHDGIAAEQYDQARTQFLNGEGITVLRFRNEQVIKEVHKVLKEIRESLLPSPPPGEEGK